VSVGANDKYAKNSIEETGMSRLLLLISVVVFMCNGGVLSVELRSLKKKF
jgi:hypothetical protein